MVIKKKILEICCQKSKLTSCHSAKGGNYWLAILPLKVVGYKFALYLQKKKSVEKNLLIRFHSSHF